MQAINELLHEYGGFIIGRLGIPYREKGIKIISIVIDAPQDAISTLSGKIGRQTDCDAVISAIGRLAPGFLQFPA